MKKYIRASFNTGTIPDWLKGDKSALEALNRNNIDLANCTFSKERKGRVGDNYIAYLVKGSKDFDSYSPFVWIPGIYNDDHYVSFQDYNKRSWDGHWGAKNSSAIKYFAKKDLNFIDTVYINIADNSKARREHYQDPRYDSNGKYAGQYYIPDKKNQWNSETKAYDKFEPAHWSEAGQTTWEGGRYGHNKKRDKSGYIIPDPKDRLKKFHETEEGQSRQAKKASRQLELIYGELVKLKDAILDDLNNASFDSFGTKNYALRYFQEALNNYKTALNELTPRKYGNEEWSDPEGALSYAERARDNIADAKAVLEGKRSW